MKKIQASDNDLLIVTILFSLIGSLLSLPFYLSIYGISTGILAYLSGTVLIAYALYFSVITYNSIKEGGYSLLTIILGCPLFFLGWVIFVVASLIYIFKIMLSIIKKDSKNFTIKP